MSSDPLYRLHQPFLPAGDQPQAIQNLLQGIEADLRYQTLLGVTGSGKTYTMAQVIAKSERPALVFAPNKTLAAQLYSEMRTFFPHNAVEYFVSYYDYYQPEAYLPAQDLFIEKDSSINHHIEQMRLSATKSLLERQDVIIVATVSAIYGIGNPAQYHEMMLLLRKSEQIEQAEIIQRLVSMQYHRVQSELQRGSFRIRGDTIDIFPAEHADHAVRVSLFDNEIESLALVDPISGKKRQDLVRFSVYPSNHYVTPRKTILKAVERIQEELRERTKFLVANHQFVEAQRLEQRTRFDLEMMNELGFCKGIENYTRHLSGTPAGHPPPTLLDYLPQEALIFVDESHITIPQFGGMSHGDRVRKENLVEFGFRLPSARDNRPLTFTEFEAFTQQTIFVSATPSVYEKQHQQQVVEQIVRPTGLLDPQIEVRPAGTQVEDIVAHIRTCIQQQQRIIIATLTKRMSEKLCHYLGELRIAARYVHSDIDTVERVEILRDLRLGKFDVLIGINLLREGIDLPEVALIGIFDADREGFLRSERSLIQMIGRVARNVHGRAILYADRITASMQQAMDETHRRRKRQHQYNLKHNVTPRNIQKDITDIIDGVSLPQASPYKKATALIDPHLDPAEAQAEISAVQTKMVEAAKNLEFEAASRYRDQLDALKAHFFPSTQGRS